MRINQVLAAKANPEVITVSPDATVRDLLRLMAEHNVGALVVSSDGKRLDGIVSERDVVRRLN
jgi:CBS domain-containing protein